MKKWLFLGLVIIIAVIIGVVFIWSKKTRPKMASPVTDNIGCPKELAGVLTQSFIDPKNILAIRPLGFTTGRDHILPVDHVGFTLKANSSDGKVPVYAPSQITITQISKHTDYAADGKPFTTSANYMFEFTICPEVTGWSEFIQDLSPQLQTIWDQAKKQHDEGPLNQGARAVNDSTTINYVAQPGELIGYTHPQPSLALSIFDRRSKPSGVDFDYYIDKDRRPFAVCFTDYYSGDLKKVLTDKYGYYEDRQGMMPGFTPRTVEPKCGQTIQNVAGTIQGDWFANRPKQSENLEAEGKTISFIHNNYDPTIALISIGGTVTLKPDTPSFKPTHDGTINREFLETKIGETYCYQNEPNLPAFIFAPANNNDRIIVQLLDDHHLKVEAQSGSCQETALFNHAFTYER